jgi:hypothetical protein
MVEHLNERESESESELVEELSEVVCMWPCKLTRGKRVTEAFCRDQSALFRNLNGACATCDSPLKVCQACARHGNHAAPVSRSGSNYCVFHETHSHDQQNPTRVAAQAEVLKASRPNFDLDKDAWLIKQNPDFAKVPAPAAERPQKLVAKKTAKVSTTIRVVKPEKVVKPAKPVTHVPVIAARPVVMPPPDAEIIPRVKKLTGAMVRVLQAAIKSTDSGEVAQKAGIARQSVAPYFTQIFQVLGLTNERILNRRAIAVRVFLAAQAAPKSASKPEAKADTSEADDLLCQPEVAREFERKARELVAERLPVTAASLGVKLYLPADITARFLELHPAFLPQFRAE